MLTEVATVKSHDGCGVFRGGLSEECHSLAWAYGHLSPGDGTD